MFSTLETAAIAQREFGTTMGSSSHLARPNERWNLVGLTTHQNPNYNKTQQQLPDKIILINIVRQN